MENPELKSSYRIGEISRLFGIGQDSLRYYERIGVLHPQRTANGYRSYDLSDICTLSLIKELRRAGLSMARIKEYLDTQSLSSTRSLMEEEISLIDERIAELAARQEELREHLDEIDRTQKNACGQLLVEERPVRRCVQLAAHLVRDDEMDLIITRLHRRYESQIPRLGSMQIGAFLAAGEIAAGATNVYNAVFFVLPDESVPCDFALDAGRYLSYCYRGPYVQNGPIVRMMADRASQMDLVLEGDPFEVYLVDNRTTRDEREFLTRIEIAVK